jgi:predicted dienelactone hydrolase
MIRRRWIARVVILFAVAVLCIPAAAQEQTLRQRIAERRGAADRSAEDLRIGALQVSVWRPAGDSIAPAPLVIFSHGFHGTSTQSTFLMQALAARGYLVVAPDHADSMRELAEGSWMPEEAFRKAELWSPSTYRDRADDIAAMIEFFRVDAAWKGLIDMNRIALAGHSLGGYTVLGLAGAWPEWKLPEAKAILALSPYCTPYVKNGSLHAIDIPVMYQGGTRDPGVTPSVIKGGGAFELTPAPAYYVEFDGAGHFAWSDLDSRYHESIAWYSIAFLDRHLRGDTSADPLKRLPEVSALRSK